MVGKVFRDPIYEYIAVTKEELRLIDSPWFQRLRHCSQNGPGRLVYPSLLGTRFEHSLGTMELGSRVLDSILDRSKYEDPCLVDRFLRQAVRDFAVFLNWRIPDDGAYEALRKLFRMACLCHDLGHFPLSHTFEQAFEQELWLDAIPSYGITKRSCHEVVSAEILRQLAFEHDRGLVENSVARGAILILLAPPEVRARHKTKPIAFGDSVFNALSSMLIGDYDVDRLDYMQRDGQISGVGFGTIDLERFVKSMMLVESDGQFEVMPSSRALSTVEAALLERYKEYKWVSYHHKVIFYHEVAAEVSKDILADPEVRRRLFVRSPGKAPSKEEYYDKVMRALGSPREELPPLSLYIGKKIGRRSGAYVLNGKFLVSNTESHFVDDVWFCLKCRTLCIDNKSEGKFYLQALVDRKRCGLSLWKDLPQFQAFENKFIGELNRRKPLVDLMTEGAADRFHASTGPWARRLWNAMRQEGGVGEQTCKRLGEHITEELRRSYKAKVRALIALVKWSKLFGDLGRKRVLGRRGNPDDLIDNSNLLGRLKGLEGEIPFFVYLAGEEEEVGRLVRRAKEDKLLQVAARGLVGGLLSCWKDEETPEPRGLWLEVTGQDA